MRRGLKAKSLPSLVYFLFLFCGGGVPCADRFREEADFILPTKCIEKDQKGVGC